MDRLVCVATLAAFLTTNSCYFYSEELVASIALLGCSQDSDTHAHCLWTYQRMRLKLNAIARSGAIQRPMQALELCLVLVPAYLAMFVDGS